MKFKIHETGALSIDRAGPWVAQQCPFTASLLGEPYCTHSCPHFGEPFTTELGPPPHSEWQLNLCHGTVLIGELIDERSC